MTLAESLEALRTALEAKADPAYAPLLALVREPCPCASIDWPLGTYLAYEEHPIACKGCYIRGHHDAASCYCNGTGFTTRVDYWCNAPEGAFISAAIEAVRFVGDDEVTGNLIAILDPYCRPIDEAEYGVGIEIEVGKSLNQQGIEAVLEWLKEEA